jgi:hypothetical protein
MGGGVGCSAIKQFTGGSTGGKLDGYEIPLRTDPCLCVACFLLGLVASLREPSPTLVIEDVVRIKPVEGEEQALATIPIEAVYGVPSKRTKKPMNSSQDTRPLMMLRRDFQFEGMARLSVVWNVSGLSRLALVSLVAALACTTLAGCGCRPSGEWQSVEELPLSDLPGVSETDATKLKSAFPGLADPVLFDRRNKVAQISVADYPERGEVLSLVANADQLSQLVNEKTYISSRGYLSRTGDTVEGFANGALGLAAGLWEIARHPVKTASAAAKAVSSALNAAYSESPEELTKMGLEFANAYYTSRCIEVGDANAIPYGMTILPETQQCIQGEVNGEITGEAAFEVATLLVPILKVGKAKHLATASRAAEISAGISKLSAAGRVPEAAGYFAKYAGYFSKSATIFANNLAKRRLPQMPRVGKLPVASVGKAISTAYRETFFAKHPHLQGKVVVHHAVEQQALTRYPKLFGPEEIHSLENLRGIPNSRNASLHNGIIRREWNEFYRTHPASTTTRSQVLQKATEIDRKCGCLFDPPLF